MLTLKDTVAVSPEDCFDQWHHVTCRQFSTTESDRNSYRSFQASVAIRDFGPLTISNIWSSTSEDQQIRVTRGAAEIRKDPRDYFMLWLTLGGGVSFAQADRVARLDPDDIFLHDQARPFVLEFSKRAHAMMVSIPRNLLASRVSAAPNLLARRVSGQSNLGALTRTMVHRLALLEGAIHEDALNRLTSSLLDVIAATLDTELNCLPERDSAHERRLKKVKSYILRNLHDAELDLDGIAKAQSLAPRTLSRLFANEGTTPIRWLWQQRLTASYSALAEGKVHQVTEAALSYGFADLSHFSRAFKAAFGKSPHDVMPRRPTRS